MRIVPTYDMYEGLIVRYFAELLTSKTDMPLSEAVQLLEEPIREELSTAEDRGLFRINAPLGEAMVGRAGAPDMHMIFYVEKIRAQDATRWAREGVTEEDIIAWYDLGGVMQGAYIAFDNFFNLAQVVDSVEHAQGFDSLEEIVEYGQ